MLARRLTRRHENVTIWQQSYRADPVSRSIADRHYNRQNIGAVNFTPPGRCLVLRHEKALWVTSWPYAEYVMHAWAGAWVNSMFRNEGAGTSSELIRQAIASTRAYWPNVPPLGMITFVDPTHVRPIKRRGTVIYGYCYLMAGFKHVGFTKGGLWAWQMLPIDMPDPCHASGSQLDLLSC